MICNRCMDTGLIASYPESITCPDCQGRAGLPMVPPLRYTGPALQPGKPGDAGIDLPAADETWVPSGAFGSVPIEVSVELPEGYWGWIIQRSSTFWKKHLMVNQAVIDNGYRGQLFVAVFNLDAVTYRVRKGERLAQLVLVPLVEPQLIHITPDEFSTETIRGTSGFGSTG